jgi:hypothetical protein
VIESDISFVVRFSQIEGPDILTLMIEVYQWLMHMADMWEFQMLPPVSLGLTLITNHGWEVILDYFAAHLLHTQMNMIL